MKFLHTADWHLGKIVNDHSMIEDQRVVLHRLLDDLKDHPVEAILISGDLYDRSLPPREAVVLANEIFSRIHHELKIPILLIAGNHDSGERLDFGSSFYDTTIHFQGLPQKTPYITIINEVQFILLPFADYPVLSKLYPETTIKSLEDGFKVQKDRIHQQLDPNRPSVLLFHGYLSGGNVLSESTSERPLSIGTTEVIEKEYFEAFDYVALGHLHQAQKVNQEQIRYSGSILKYSKSEANHQKQALIVTLEKDSLEITPLPLRPKRDLIVKRGYFDDLMKESNEAYVYLELLDEHFILDAMNKLQARYPNALALEYVFIKPQSTRTSLNQHQLKSMDPLELFEEFYQNYLNQPLNQPDKVLLNDLIQEVKHETD